MRGVNLELEERGVYGLVGKTGSGKTTLGKILCGLLSYDEGEVIWNPQFIKARTQVQMIFQNAYASFNPLWSMKESLFEALRNSRINFREGLEDKILPLMREMNLSQGLLKSFPSQLSGGQLQRFCILRALLLEPKVLVCDEIVSALDLESQVLILGILRELNKKNLTIIFISHDLRVVYNLCDEIFFLKDGTLKEHILKRESSLEDLLDAQS